MFVWPDQVMKKFVTHFDPVDDFVDRLNYVYTVGFFMFLATLAGTKQHFGTVIQCMAPTYFPGAWIDYVHDYCFVSNTYMVNVSRIIVQGKPADVLKQEIVYYQWVPYVLLLQALLCYLPKFLWNIIIMTRDLDIRSVTEEAMKIPSVTTWSVRRKHLRRVADLAIGYIKYNQRRRTIKCCSTYHFYAFVKWFYFASCLCQVLLINNFVGDGSLLWGYRVVREMLKGNDWKTSGVFPRVTFCDVKIAQLGQMNIHTMQCSLMINAVNEKSYLLLWFWLFSLLLIDAMSAIYSTLLLFCPSLHYARVLSQLQPDHKYIDAKIKRCLLNFTENVLRLDGILLLSFIKDHVGGTVASDLTYEIWLIVNEYSNRGQCVEAETCVDQNFVCDEPSSTKSQPEGINAFGPVME